MAAYEDEVGLSGHLKYLQEAPLFIVQVLRLDTDEVDAQALAFQLPGRPSHHHGVPFPNRYVQNYHSASTPCPTIIDRSPPRICVMAFRLSVSQIFSEICTDSSFGPATPSLTR